MMLSSIGKLWVRFSFAADRASVGVRSTTFPFFMAATAWSAWLSTESLKNYFEHLINGNGWYYKIWWIIQWINKVYRLRFISEISEPGWWISNIHVLSFSLSKLVLIPFKKPLSSFMSFSGINSILPSYSTTCIFYPGQRFRVSLTVLGRTTWTFSETGTECMSFSYR